jgi:hypothetical protein
MNTEIKLAFKDAKCPVFFADAQPVVVWSADGFVRFQFRSVHISDPATPAEVSPLVEIVMTLPVFYSMLDGANGQSEQLEKQGVKRIPLAAVAPADTGGHKH